MALGPRLDIRQSQSLVMTPQLQQAIKLLALSNLEVETFIGEALDANPLLEMGDAAPGLAGEEAPGEDLRRTHLESSPVDQLVGEGRAAEDRPLDIDSSALDLDRDTGDGAVALSDLASSGLREGTIGADGGGSSGGEGPDIDERGASAASLAEHLHGQIGATTSDAQLLFVGRWLIDQLDETGYLRMALPEVAEALGLPLSRVEAALALVQTLDPTGVGARTLGECLALQAREADRYDPLMARLLDNLDLLGRGELARLRRLCGVDEEDFADMLAELRGYDPKPGLRIGSGPAEAISPDILVQPARGEGDPADDAGAEVPGWAISLNPATLPRVLVNRSYYVEMRRSCVDKTARAWLGERLADANWLVKALDQRQKTILKVAAEIVKQQEGFFRHGVSHLRPMTLRTVAEAVKMHESTISRVTSNKYLHCLRGTFELKYFFTSGVAGTDGEGVSAEAVKAAIRQLIDGEDPKAILSDDALVDLLKARGFDLARRTVAKYREAIGLGSSVQRRRQKALAGVR
ncbi:MULTISPECIES: RNA polymerase factor sigma-54 [unclassified Novosphingobium]|uniref:RNA polymerase factor sigma-54 n=1 Tax=unclassified Novosphingobium TaxID=2644732 RepID=UPI0014429842|nr:MULTISPECIES: RNA polymerase factor sigma-54 [unclassified Novosphingobium]MBB3359263.1 RNA polymerase sigma-54 factor [Novosphingobium sp. BK256]MBB3375256.1 RNA polymerase sigma-54 factor [Novosphingobium sp. BK280]MBB3380036.1 RNA polymerase sigma-54 factor [Novosphingobium sp. BK258]MBB3421730.1 RNA polymerase sigma-54 factor [Novosphingobium sp. BK267]MBB3450045.1 RNA polymerase sigma-54 factor [Novosphingobium sp. BK352]